jgi:TetR/AcrR family transcriptional regulator, regulator of cefoperazone and chloramphenicol sensitivity
VAESPPTGTSASRRDVPRRRSADGRQRLLEAAEQLFATRGLGVPNHEIVVAAGLHNQSAVTYHFESRAGLVDAVRERHETPIAQHRHYLISRLQGTEDRTTRQLVDAHIQPLAAEMLRCAPSHWARLSEMLLLDQPLRFTRDAGTSVRARLQLADAVLSELLELTAAHLRHLPKLEAADRVALTVRFLTGGLARWERDSQADIDYITPLATFTLILTDLAVAMLDAPSSLPPPIDAQL